MTSRSPSISSYQRPRSGQDFDLPRYVYTPLPGIHARMGRRAFPSTRVMVLWHGDNEDTLRCSLEVINLKSPPEYEALSYTWGQVLSKTPLYCENGTIELSENLENALRYIRSTKQPKRLWVDSVCVNQDDVTERTYEVSHMRLIYKKSTRVIVWLGLPVANLSKVFILARGIHKNTMDPELDKVDELAPKEGLKLLRAQSDHELIMADLEVRRVMLEFFGRPYFRRIWCIQEILFAKDVLAKCGHLETDFREILAAAPWSHVDPVFSRVSALQAWGYVHYMTHRGSKETDEVLKRAFDTRCHKDEVYGWQSDFNPEAVAPLLELLEWTAEFEASDPRDKVFTLYGMSFEGTDPYFATFPKIGIGTSPIAQLLALIPALIQQCRLHSHVEHAGGDPRWPGQLQTDYRMSLLDVCTTTALHLMQSKPGLLDVLAHVSHDTDPCDPLFPSWVPKWHEKPVALRVGHKSLFSAGLWSGRKLAPFGKIEAHPDLQHHAYGDKKLLQVNGFCVDTVAYQGPVMVHTSDYDSVDFDKIYMEFFDGQTPYPGAITERIISDPASLRVDCAKALTMYGQAWSESSRTRWAERCPDQVRQMCLAAGTGTLHQLFRDSDKEAMTRLQLTPDEQEFIDQVYHRLECTPIDLMIEKYAAGRRLYMTPSGKIGLGPKVMKEGDIVAVFFGGRTPFILRPTKTEGQYIFIGETYLQDLNIMWGQTVDEIRKGKDAWRKRTFILR